MGFSYFQDRDKFLLLLEDTENWLYEDGEDCSRKVYIDKLAELNVSFLIPLIPYCGFHCLNCIPIIVFDVLLFY